jgi:hypothetical protein
MLSVIDLPVAQLTMASNPTAPHYLDAPSLAGRCRRGELTLFTAVAP